MSEYFYACTHLYSLTRMYVVEVYMQYELMNELACVNEIIAH